MDLILFMARLLTDHGANEIMGRIRGKHALFVSEILQYLAAMEEHGQFFYFVAFVTD